MASLAPCTNAKAEADLGVQDSVSRRFISTQCEKDHICGCRPGVLSYQITIILHPYVQVVRADLRELLEMPLEGAPYAYTPFCDSRPDMEGFRLV